MPSTDRKLELTAKASMAQPVSQPAVCCKGLNILYTAQCTFVKKQLTQQFISALRCRRVGCGASYQHCVYITDDTVCPTRYRTWLAGGPLLRVPPIRRTTDIFLFISHTMNVLLFKFRCNIFIGVRIIKGMPGSLASGTLCIMTIIKVSQCCLYRACLSSYCLQVGPTLRTYTVKLRSDMFRWALPPPSSG